MVYQFHKVSGRRVEVAPVLASYQDVDLTLRADELLVVLWKETDVVADIAYSAPRE